MKTFKSIFRSTFGLLAIATASLSLGSCEQNSCTALNCVNGGVCNEDKGTCECPEGYLGSECTQTANSKYQGTYSGTVRCNYEDNLFPIVPDSIVITPISDPNKIKITIKAGNTSLENFEGQIIDENTATFTPLVNRDNNGNVISQIDAFIKFDGIQIDLMLQTVNHLPSGEIRKQACSFIGKKVVADN